MTKNINILTNKFYLLCLLAFYLISNGNNNNLNKPNNFPEFIHYNKQTLKLLIPSEKCPISLFFFDKEEYNFSKNVVSITI